MRVGFAGTPAFAARALETIIEAGLTVPLVLTQPDRPAGRGLKSHASAVKDYALAQNLPLIQPAGLRLDGNHAAVANAAHASLTTAALDVLVVVAYGLLLPSSVLSLPRLGCINIHGSLLPRWRGAAPIQRAIEAGDRMTGVTVIQMDAGLDTGPMLAQAEWPITPQTSTQQLYEALAALGATQVVKVLDQLERGVAVPQAQATTGISYAHKINKPESALDFTCPALQLHRKILAFDPMPGTFFEVAGERFKVWGAQPIEPVAEAAKALPGTVLTVSSAGIAVACGEGVLQLTELQRPGGRRGSATSLAHTLQWAPGMIFTSSL